MMGANSHPQTDDLPSQDDEEHRIDVDAGLHSPNMIPMPPDFLQSHSVSPFTSVNSPLLSIPRRSSSSASASSVFSRSRQGTGASSRSDSLFESNLSLTEWTETPGIWHEARVVAHKRESTALMRQRSHNSSQLQSSCSEDDQAMPIIGNSSMASNSSLGSLWGQQGSRRFARNNPFAATLAEELGGDEIDLQAPRTREYESKKQQMRAVMLWVLCVAACVLGGILVVTHQAAKWVILEGAVTNQAVPFTTSHRFFAVDNEEMSSNRRKKLWIRWLLAIGNLFLRWWFFLTMPVFFCQLSTSFVRFIAVGKTKQVVWRTVALFLLDSFLTSLQGVACAWIVKSLGLFTTDSSDTMSHAVEQVKSLSGGWVLPFGTVAFKRARILRNHTSGAQAMAAAASASGGGAGGVLASSVNGTVFQWLNRTAVPSEAQLYMENATTFVLRPQNGVFVLNNDGVFSTDGMTITSVVTRTLNALLDDNFLGAFESLNCHTVAMLAIMMGVAVGLRMQAANMALDQQQLNPQVRHQQCDLSCASPEDPVGDTTASTIVSSASQRDPTKMAPSASSDASCSGLSSGPCSPSHETPPQTHFVWEVLLEIQVAFQWLCDESAWLAPWTLAALLLGNVLAHQGEWEAFIGPMTWLVTSVVLLSLWHGLVIWFAYFHLSFGVGVREFYRQVVSLVPAYGFAFWMGSAIGVLSIESICFETARTVRLRVAHFVTSLGSFCNQSSYGLYLPLAMMFLAVTSGTGDQFGALQAVEILLMSWAACVLAPVSAHAAIPVMATMWRLMAPVNRDEEAGSLAVLPDTFVLLMACQLIIARIVNLVNVHENAMIARAVADMTDEMLVM